MAPKFEAAGSLFIPPERSRLWIGLAIAVVGPLLVTPIAQSEAVASRIPYVLVVAAATAFGRLLAASVATVLSAVLLRTSFTAAGGGILPSQGDFWSLVVFIVVALVVAELLVLRERTAGRQGVEHDRLAFLAEVGDAISGPLDVDGVLERLGEVLVPELADWFAVDLLEDGAIRSALVLHANPTKVQAARELQQRFPSNPDAPTGASRVIRTGTSELTERITDEMLRALVSDPELVTEIRALGLRCAMVVPLTARGHTFGALTLAGAEEHERYDSADLRLAEEIADRAALAVDTARLFAAETEARAAAQAGARRSEVLKDATAAFGAATTVEEVTLAMLDQGIRLAGAAAGTVGLRVADGIVEVTGTTGYERDDHPFWTSFSLADDLPMSDAIRERRPIVISTTVERDRRYPLLKGRGEQLDHALVCLPLLLGGEVIGGFSASYPPNTSFGNSDLAFLRALGEQCAQAVDRVRSVARERETRARFNALANASRALASSLDFDATAANVVRLAAEHLGRRVALYAREGSSLTLLREHEPSPEADPAAATSAPPAGAVSVAVLDALEQQAPQLLADPRGAGRPGIVLPLTIAGSTFGAVVVEDAVRDFDHEDELEFAREIARRMARAMENARLYRDRDYVAKVLQESLLPTALPEIPCIEVEALFLPAIRGYEIGGDFYDVFEAGPGRWAAVVGDVCGKGVEAATLTGLARHTLRAMSEVPRPSDALTALNRTLLREHLDGRFCTVAYAMIEPLPDGGARLRVALGGHPRPQLLAVDGSVTRVGRPGMLLGVAEQVGIEDVELVLRSGDVLVAFTDGVLTRQDFGDQPEDLIGRLRAGPWASAADVRTVVEGYVRELIKPVQEDDIAVVIVRAR
jgi:GAF domain-containing protein